MKKYIIIDTQLKETVKDKKGNPVFFDTEAEAITYAVKWFNTSIEDEQSFITVYTKGS